ncbi:hypothetical protein FJT64_006052 [Amphibalanus amphitrite]|uniref:F-box domain-containing protein n=1 Tax=Amphibalanus amphitrite TaxID=1232801 RepID=A0A6A4VS42_AMPAM|nr:hypothetical protein FJT64_006052 [Amphibalanus amphitrite]
MWQSRRGARCPSPQKDISEYSLWHLLPELVLVKIFRMLNMNERYIASLVCWNWAQAFNLPDVWRVFVLDDTVLTKSKYNYYLGWQKTLDHIRTSTALDKMARHIRTLVIRPMANFYNMYSFMNALSAFAQRYPGSLDGVIALRYTFVCTLAEKENDEVFGTGGEILRSLQRLMGHLAGLRDIELVDLLLERVEGMHALDQVSVVCCETMRVLKLINITKFQVELLHPGVFINLRELHISPQNLGDDLLYLLAENKLRNLHLIQNEHTESTGSVGRRSWRDARLRNSRLRVHLRLEGKPRHQEIIWQQDAPVKSILYRSPYIAVSAVSILTTIEYYGTDLEVYGHLGLPRFHRSASFHERADGALVMLLRHCPLVHTLVVRERISSATVLLLAHTGKNLRRLFVRANAVLLRADWPRSPEWSPQFYDWLRGAARSYGRTEAEVSRLLGYPWCLLSDKVFRALRLDLNQSHYWNT